MIYLWKTPTKFYESTIGDDLSRYIGIYNKGKGPNYSLLNSGRYDAKLFEFSKEELIFEFETTKYELIVNDVLENNADFIIVNERVRKVLEQFAINDIQYLTPTIICTNGELNNYSIVNVLPRVSGINREKSQCEFYSDDPNKISGFRFGTRDYGIQEWLPRKASYS
jgi:hypothetical protein